MLGDITMDNDNNSILPMNNWFNRILDLRNRWWNNNRSSSLFDTTDMFRDFEDMHREMNRMFNVFNDILKNAPKELVREYQTPDGAKVQEVGPLVYGYSMTIGADGKPHVREFGNVKAGKDMYLSMGKPQITAEREPLSDITTSDK